MPLPIDLAGDWRLMNADLLRTIGYRAYDPAADDGTGEPHGAGESCVGVRGVVSVREEGGRSVSRATWTITGTAARPVARSLIVDGTDSWVIDTVTPDPATGTVFQLDTHKG